MAARSRTLLELRAAVRGRCMIESESQLVSDALLNEWINESIQDFRLELSNEDVEAFMTVATGTLTTGVVSGAAHGSLPLPDSAYAVYGLDITVADRLVNVPPMSFAERNDFQCGTQKTGVPAGFHITNIGAESDATVGAGTIILAPAPDAAYAYRLWYLPVWTDLDADTDVFNTVGGGDRWVVWDVCVKVAARTNDAKNQAAIATSERDRAMARIIRTIKRMNRAGAVRRRDSRSERWP
jgi:hypothetical protein